MTYLVEFPTENKPEWFVDRFQKIQNKLETLRDRSWIWMWNDTYEHRVSVNAGVIYLVFEDEKAYTWFILKEM